jgi:hypothetical protein
VTSERNLRDFQSGVDFQTRQSTLIVDNSELSLLELAGVAGKVHISRSRMEM